MRRERAGGEEREDGGAEAGDVALGHQDRLAEHVGVDRLSTSFFCGMPPPLMMRWTGTPCSLHALEDDAGVEGGAFDGGEELVLRGVGEAPAERDAAEFGVDQDGAVAVVPGEAQQAGLAGAVVFEAFGERGDGGAGAAGDGFEDVAGGGEAGFDAGARGIDRAGDDAADAGDQVRRCRRWR